MSRQTGRVTIKVDGNTLASGPNGAKLKIGGPKREGFMSDQGDFVFKEMLEPAILTGELLHLASTDLDTLRGLVDGVAEFSTDTGVVWSIAGLVTTEIGEISDGKVTCTWAGKPAVRVS